MGRSDFSLTLTRMGANVTAQGPWSEPWRMVTAGFLHFGPGHLLSNLGMLFVLGLLLEPILGPWRLVFVLVAGVVAGNVASALSGQALLAAGVSGGLFALLGAQAALSLRKRGVIAPLSRGGILRIAAVFLVINVVSSFHPGIDWRAHLAGGLLGAALAGSGLLTLGMPPILSGREESRGARRAWRAIGVSTALLCAAAFAAALHAGRPWRLLRPQPLVRVQLAGSPFSIGVPEDAVEARTLETHGAWTEHFFGDAASDPVLVAAAVKKLDEPAAGDGRVALLEELKRSMEAEPDAKKVPQGRLRLETIAGRPALVLDQLRGGEVKMPRWIFVEGGWMLDLELSLAPGLPERWERLAPEIARAVQVQP